jgi:hypothetical protein
LDYRGADPIEVDDTFVATLPSGAPLTPPDVPGLGEPGSPLPGSSQPTTVGTIYADRTNASYVMTRDGLASLTPLQVQLLLADPALAAAYAGSDPTPLKVTQAQVTEASPKPWMPSGTAAPAPPTAPTLAEPAPGEQQFCARHTGGAAPELVVGPAEPAPGGSAPTDSTGPVRLAPGQGALIAQRQGPEGNGSAVFLVTDSGVRYPLADQRAVEALGLATSPVAQLGPELIAALPVGPTLDRAAAATPAG